MLAPGRTGRLLESGFWVGGTPRGARIDCCHSHTGIGITDTGLKAFSAALGSSTTVTTVFLDGKSEWLAMLL